MMITLFSAFVPRAASFMTSPSFVARAAGANSFVLSRMSMSSEAQPKKGTVKWFNTQKGYGFITPEDGSADIFVHQTAILVEGFRSLAEGEPVEFKIQTENGKSKAVDVTGPDGADVQGAPFQPQSDFNRY